MLSPHRARARVFSFSFRAPSGPHRDFYSWMAKRPYVMPSGDFARLRLQRRRSAILLKAPWQVARDYPGAICACRKRSIKWGEAMKICSALTFHRLQWMIIRQGSGRCVGEAPAAMLVIGSRPVEFSRDCLAISVDRRAGFASLRPVNAPVAFRISPHQSAGWLGGFPAESL